MRVSHVLVKDLCQERTAHQLYKKQAAGAAARTAGQGHRQEAE